MFQTTENSSTHSNQLHVITIVDARLQDGQDNK